MKHVSLVGAAAFALSVAPALAQQPSTPPSPQPKAMSSTDKSSGDHHFVMEAAQGGMAEVELGKIATDKAASPDVKKFAQRMVDDHGKANDELKTLAQNKNIMLPTAIDAKQKAKIDKLSKMSGEAFDRAYMKDMLADHRKDVAAFRTESKSGKDADVKAWAAKTLPTLEEHLKQAEDANRAVGTSGTMSKKPTAKSK